MSRATLRAALVVLGLGLSACAHVPYFEPEPSPPATEGVWAARRVAVMRSGKLYDGFTTNAFATVYYQSLPAREARVERLAQWNASSVQEREAALAKERDEAAKYDDFLVALFTPDPADNDLDAPRSVWRVALVVPGAGDALPLSMHQVRSDATLRELYPEVNAFDVVYLVRFARWPGGLDGKPFLLRMGGAKGLLEFRYDASAPAPGR